MPTVACLHQHPEPDNDHASSKHGAGYVRRDEIDNGPTKREWQGETYSRVEKHGGRNHGSTGGTLREPDEQALHRVVKLFHHSREHQVTN